MNIGKSIRKALIDRDMRQNQLAAKMGVGVRWMSRMANSRVASMQTVEALANQFDMTVSEFIKLGED
jgi:transcriptional regulator with XRE-family HTH domain